MRWWWWLIVCSLVNWQGFGRGLVSVGLEVGLWYRFGPVSSFQVSRYFSITFTVIKSKIIEI